MKTKKSIRIDLNKEIRFDRNESRINTYLNEIRKYEITEDQKVIDQWVLEYQTTGSEVARTKAIKALLRYATVVAANFYKRPLQLSDLIDEANEALIRALDTYDATQERHFMTYATRSMINTLLDYCNQYRNSLTVRDEIEDEDPYEDIITDPEVLDKYRQVHHPGDPQTVSLDAPVGHEDEDSFTLADVLACEDTTVEDWERLHDAKTIAQVILSQLTPQEQRILCMTYGIGCRQLNDCYIAQQLDLPSPERVRQIRQFALTKALCITIHQ